MKTFAAYWIVLLGSAAASRRIRVGGWMGGYRAMLLKFVTTSASYSSYSLQSTFPADFPSAHHVTGASSFVIINYKILQVVDEN